MDRRAFLALAAGGTLGSLAGCTGRPAIGDSSPTPGEVGTTAGDGTVSSVAGEDLPLPKSKLSRGAPKDAIPAITEPSFAADWSGLEITVRGRFGETYTTEPRLSPSDHVLGVARDGEARAYPLRVLDWHEIVNDTFGGPLLVTYCPLCGSGITAERRVDGTPTVFGVSGYLWNSALVMYDQATESLWSQIAATAVRGPKTGERLSLVPSRLTTLGTWREDHPDTKVLLPPPESNTVRGREAVRDYTRSPYGGYKSSRRIGIGQNDVPKEATERLHPKTQVLGVVSDGVAKAYPLPAVEEAGVVNDTVGSLPVVVAAAADGFTLVAYDRRVDGTTLEFERASETHLKAGGSLWKLTAGRAVDGPHAGTTLEPAAAEPQMFWFAWVDFKPDTKVYGDG